jgi:hypothetical protein
MEDFYKTDDNFERNVDDVYCEKILDDIEFL